jgi:hypothetical protein
LLALALVAELVEQSLSISQIGGVEALGETAVRVAAIKRIDLRVRWIAQDEPSEPFLGADRWSAVLPRPRLLEL